jgi:predicted hydrocarbon binding protein
MSEHKNKNKITVEECTDEVKLMARRLGLLHYYFSQAIVDRLGEEEGKALIKEAIWAYGRHCGAAVRAGVEAMGLPLTDENYGRVRDLPKYGWEVETVTLDSGEVRPIAAFCPIAATLKELGPRGMELGRLYCYVDQAKYEAYNPDMEFIHTKNLLDGDSYCEFLVQPAESSE